MWAKWCYYLNNRYVCCVFSLCINDKNRRSNNRGITQLTLSPCTKQDFFNEFSETFDSINLRQFYSKEKNYTLQGIYSSDIFHYYEILVKSRDDSLKTSKRK